MSSKETILNSIRENTITSTIKLPETNIPHISYENKNEKYAAALASVGGNAVWLEDGDINAFVAEHYKDTEVIASTCKEFTNETIDANKPNTPHALENVDLAVIKAQFAVAENGAVWVKNPENRHRALYFLAKQLLIIVDKNAIVDTMHEAYEQIEFNKSGYGLFISGPSKTADIEQSLVIGAHGPTDACILFV
ncbi:LutC/YkgG family protein [Sulfurospirillum arcachonense]|uniref:LutC/YkgG family protein n=1 Tax=Sulfurospirillum arcachonense TaxID=57666 RepID=UPI00046831AD|nr:LUD domain-containing protein [Sulfurospirillum arcachonense]